MQHGGKRNGSGRKSKAAESKLIERLSPFDDIALEKLVTGMEKGEPGYLKMFMEYRFGKPTETVNMTSENTNLSEIRIVDLDGTEI